MEDCTKGPKIDPAGHCYVYHDYGSVVANESVTDAMVYNDPKTKMERNFPLKLHFVLAELAQDGYADIASWAPHGRCFVVHKPKDFEVRVLMKYAACLLQHTFLNDCTQVV
jgi:HSF-type DNA-binding